MPDDVLELIAECWKQIGISMFIKPSQLEVFRNRIFAGDSIMSMSNGVDNSFPTPDMSPAEFAPSTQQQLMWPKWGQYIETGGKSGEKVDLPAARQLAGITVNGAGELFRVDARQATLFVEVVYSADLRPSDALRSADGRTLLDDARSAFSFVAIKNGIHNQEGYLIDTGTRPGEPQTMAVQDIHRRIVGSYAPAGTDAR